MGLLFFLLAMVHKMMHYIINSRPQYGGKKNTKVTNMAKAQIVERRIVDGAYGLNHEQAIIDHPKYGRILISDGFGGQDVEGLTYRWRHGVVTKLCCNDNFQILDEPGNDFCSKLDIAINGGDSKRAKLPFSGYVVERMAKSAGL